MKFLIWIVISIMVSIAAGYFKFCNMEEIDKEEVREFRMRDRKTDTGFKQTQHYVEKRGNFTSCGKSSARFSFQWSPFVIDIQEKFTLYADLVAPVSFKSGLIDVTIYDPEQPDQPIVKLDFKGTCTTFAAILPVKCPIAAKAIIKDQLISPYTMGVPTGKYMLVVNITNEDKEMFACARAEMEFVMHSEEKRGRGKDMTD